MKSAYELAMERLGGSRSYTNGQKQQMAEIDRKFEARLAEARLRAEDHFLGTLDLVQVSGEPEVGPCYR